MRLFFYEFGGEKISLDNFIRAHYIKKNVICGGHWRVAIFGVIGNADRKDLKG